MSSYKELYSKGTILKKVIFILIVVILIILISITFFLNCNCKFELGTDNRAKIANDLFMIEDNQFDSNFFERRLNEKYGSIDKRKDLRSFIIRNGGGCNDKNICSLNLYTTICISTIANIELMSEPKINVTLHTDGC